MNDYPNTVKETLTSLITKMSASPAHFVKNPKRDFTCKRKLPFETVMQLHLSMGGNSIYKELLEAQGYDINTATAAAFVQQRDKILPCAFEFLFHEFTQSFSDIKEILQYVENRNNEKKDTSNNIPYKDLSGESYNFDNENLIHLFGGKVTYTGSSATGTLNGKLINFIDRLENKINDKRLDFLFGKRSKNISFESTLKQLISYDENKSSVTILDLSGVPFDVLSITVSLISRILFEYGYYYKRLRCEANPEEKINNDVPLLLVYEEAHKYVPNSDLAKYRASKQSIERIAKEGRKYGISLLLASQRPSEISETIFSQCNNFLALRLTNPNDQNYVKRLLPDTLGNLIDKMPSLKAGECLLIGDAVVLPSIVQIDTCDPQPSSNDIPYFELWKEKWKDLDISAIKESWYKD